MVLRKSVDYPTKVDLRHIIVPEVDLQLGPRT